LIEFHSELSTNLTVTFLSASLSASEAEAGIVASAEPTPLDFSTLSLTPLLSRAPTTAAALSLDNLKL
jgi:hypothetical protein